MIIRMTVFLTVCTQNYIAMRNLNCAIQMTIRRCFPVTYLSNHAGKSPYKMPWPLNCDLGGGATWPSNHFRLYTARICTEAQETRAPCMFDWQDTQTRATHLLLLWNAKSQIGYLVCPLGNSNIAVASLVCTLRNSNIAVASLVCTLHNSKLQLLLSCVHCVIQIVHFSLVWKQS